VRKSVLSPQKVEPQPEKQQRKVEVKSQPLHAPKATWKIPQFRPPQFKFASPSSPQKLLVQLRQRQDSTKTAEPKKGEVERRPVSRGSTPPPVPAVVKKVAVPKQNKAKAPLPPPPRASPPTRLAIKKDPKKVDMEALHQVMKTSFISW
jgi:hypothetical protein